MGNGFLVTKMAKPVVHNTTYRSKEKDLMLITLESWLEFHLASGPLRDPLASLPLKLTTKCSHLKLLLSPLQQACWMLFCSGKFLLPSTE